ncbi:HEAT repeat domain-containing protein [Kitasatospora sp. NPDC036755]|uniref:HEAT repeat domain-containing protein n=1 Tax=Kitasatospora sp. NPDC036755 TaxID=3154600 RepID=UPI0034009AAE
MGSDPETSTVNDISGTVNGDVIQARTVNLTKTVGPTVTAESMADARAAYARRVRETYGRLDLEVLTPLSEQGEHPAVELREVFVTPQVREDPPPVELPRELVQRLLASGEFTEHSLPGDLGQSALERLRTEYLNRPTEDVLSVLAGPRGARVVLLGDPGAGKSTLARYIALTLVQDADGPLAALDGLVPLVVELRQYAEGQWRERTFEDFLDHRQAVAGMSLPGPELRQLLSRGEAVVVFDGLDELFDPGVRAATAERIAAFAARYDRARVVVTSRVIGYQRGPLSGAGFTHVMLQDLDPDRIADFARRWYAIACPTDAELTGRLVERITTAVEASRPIRELAGNPLLLTILAIIGRRQALPRDRQGVYEHAVRVLVAHWDRDTKHLNVPLTPGAAEVLDLLDDRERLELLRLLARRMQEGTGGIAGNHIHAEELEAVFRDYFTQFGYLPHQCLAAARTLRNQLRERNFILARYGSEVYGFVHRAFLEYLAAADIFQRYTVGREWTPEELIQEVFARRADDPAWHEVLLLVVNQLSEADAGKVVDHLLDRRDEGSLVLAFQALAEVRKIGLLKAQSDRAVDAVIHTAASHVAIGRMRSLTTALTALSATPVWSGRERFLRWFHVHGQFAELGAVAARVAVALHSTFGTSLTLATFGHPRVRSSAIRALAGRWSTHSDSAASLLELATHGADADSRSTALNELASRWPEHPAVLPLALRNAVEGADTSRITTLLLLTENWPKHPDVLALLLERATADPREQIRSYAARLLDSFWPDHQDVRALLQSRTGDETPPTSYNRLTDVITKNWPGASDGPTRLLELAAHDHDLAVRGVAIQGLAKRWSTNDKVLSLFLDLAANDPDLAIRSMVLTTLGRFWPGRSEVQSLLWNLAVDSADSLVRTSAFEGIGATAHDTAAVVALLGKAAVESEVAYEREAALKALARCLDPLGETARLFLERVTGDPDPRVRGIALSCYAVAAFDSAEDIVHAQAVDDPSPQVRAQALTMLAWQWPDRPETTAILRAALAGPDPEVRQAAGDGLGAVAHFTAGP